MRFWKVVLCALMVSTISACTTKEDQQEIRILTPMGATSLSLLGLYGDDSITIDTVDGTDVLTAELNKENSAYDVIIAPINLGVKLISNENSYYRLKEVVTWGNLFIVGQENALQEDGMFAAFGELAVPQKVLESSMNMDEISPEITYFNSANEVSQQLLAQKASVGLLAEPVASATIAKAKEKDMKLKVLIDLQEAYQKTHGNEKKGYPQAALFVKKGSEKRVNKAVDTAMTFANETVKEDQSAILKQIEIATIEKLGIPNADIAQATWERQNIRFIPAKEVKDEIETFLQEFNIKVRDENYAE